MSNLPLLKKGFRPLTEKDVEVWRLFAMGYTAGEIAEALCLTTGQVHTTRCQIANIHGVRNLADLTRAAVAHGVITVDRVASQQAS